MLVRGPEDIIASILGSIFVERVVVWIVDKVSWSVGRGVRTQFPSMSHAAALVSDLGFYL